MTSNLCGSCSLCCKVMSVEELDKPKNTWCSHCEKGKGCQIYHSPERPASCQAFTCLWLLTQKLDNPSLRLPERYRPDRTRVVVEIPGNLPYRAAIFWTDSAYPAAITSKENQHLIKMLSEEHVVIRARGRKRKILALNPAGAKRMLDMGYNPNVVGTEWEVPETGRKIDEPVAT
jgi:hypothetical protein